MCRVDESCTWAMTAKSKSCICLGHNPKKHLTMPNEQEALKTTSCSSSSDS